MIGKTAKAVVGVALLGVALWVYFAPYLAARHLQQAVLAKDVEALDQRVDFAAVRQRLKSDIGRKMHEKLGRSAQSAGASFGAAMAQAFLDPMVDRLVTPDNLVLILKGASVLESKEPEPAAPTSQQDAYTESGYESPNRFVVRIMKPGTRQTSVALVFSREQLLFWRLTALRLPT